MSQHVLLTLISTLTTFACFEKENSIKKYFHGILRVCKKELFREIVLLMVW